MHQRISNSTENFERGQGMEDKQTSNIYTALIAGQNNTFFELFP